MSTPVTWVPVACVVANTIVGAAGVVISRGRTDVTEGAFREYSTGDGQPVLREWVSLPAATTCRHEVPAREQAAVEAVQPGEGGFF